mmetsp:Transcript_51989/g.96218  ORF Transcript_51989/g.96218 Transcript_51989/m.96218 type:complete len:283 (-) Transcript_51989:32-880(-)
MEAQLQFHSIVRGARSGRGDSKPKPCAIRRRASSLVVLSTLVLLGAAAGPTPAFLQDGWLLAQSRLPCQPQHRMAQEAQLVDIDGLSDSPKGSKPDCSLLTQRASVMVACVALLVGVLAHVPAAEADAGGKILAGGASTGDTGSRKNMTRGVVLNGANFQGKNMRGVSFQQSSVQFGNFADSNLENASFFDADIKGANFTNAQMNQVNLELARVEDAILDNAVLTEAYISGNTNMKVKSIVGADFTDALLRKDQQKYLCSIAKGTNTFTKVDTADSLGCEQP